MTVTPRVSILLPAFNAAETLPSCLRSIQRQTEERWHCVVVDDGSDDGTLECARAFAAADDRFEVIAAPHRGLVATLNAGLPRCRADLVARMDADDLMHRHRLHAQIRILDCEPALAAIGCHVRLFPRRHLGVGRRAYETWLNAINGPELVKQEAFVECPVAHPTLMIRREVIVNYGYRDRGWPEDYDLILRLLAAGHGVGVVPRRLHLWRDWPGRLSRTQPAYAIERFIACKAEFLANGFLGATDRYALCGYGATGRKLRRALLPLGKRPSLIIDVHPGRLGRRIHGAPVAPAAELTRVRDLPIVVSVARVGRRGEIRAELRRMGFHELRDFVCAA